MQCNHYIYNIYCQATLIKGNGGDVGMVSSMHDKGYNQISRTEFHFVWILIFKVTRSIIKEGCHNPTVEINWMTVEFGQSQLMGLSECEEVCLNMGTWLAPQECSSFYL